jgi:hypothetical protein
MAARCTCEGPSDRRSKNSELDRHESQEAETMTLILDLIIFLVIGLVAGAIASF